VPLPPGDRMNAFGGIFKSNFFIKLKSWEYWPFGIIHAPLFIYFSWLSLRARSFFFFSASNPSIRMGGMFGESKFDVLELVPQSVKAKTLLQKLPTTTREVLFRMREEGMQFPVIMKPDLGERGWMVRRIDSTDDVEAYLHEIKIDFLIQEFIGLPMEFGVFYIRYPNQAEGRVTSIAEKEMLSVTGDGTKTLKELIFNHDRARLQWDSLRIQHQNRLNDVLLRGEKRELVSIGNHCLGTKFLNANSRITDKLSSSFDAISRQIDDFYFGRYDLKTASYQDLENGNIKIVELNGCGAEPAHIYDPGFSLWEAVKVLIRHWNDIYIISTQNHAQGVTYISFREGKQIYRKFRALKS
jgi:hypothetical protein